MKCAVIFYHKNASDLYRREWIDQCIDSIKNQSYKEFDVYEVNYGGGQEKFAEGKFSNYFFFSRVFENHIGAMNFIYDMLFANGYDVVFNTNLDDYYDLWRFEKQLKKIEDGYHLVSSNFVYIDEEGEPIKNMTMTEKGDIGLNLSKGHNVIAHPCTAMHRDFWGGELRYKNLIGYEDLDLWQRAYKEGKLFYIMDEYLLLYRRHEKQITTVKKPKVALLIVATGKYFDLFLEPLIRSAEEFFLKDCDVTYCVFSDSKTKWRPSKTRPFSVYPVKHAPWPHATLKRFHFFKEHKERLHADYFCYVDVDTLFKGEIRSDILSERTAVRHCGFIGKRGTYETRPESTACVGPNEGSRYYGGGFWCFSRDEFWKLVQKATWMIDTDEMNGVVPVYHDESVLNRYLIDNTPIKALSPSYHYPESKTEYYKNIWKRDYECKILLLDKNHEEVRS